jgi:hypothetical protein
VLITAKNKLFFWCYVYCGNFTAETENMTEKKEIEN